MGLGWVISQDTDLGEEVHWHTGGTVGFTTYAGMIKEKELGVVVFTTDRLSLWKAIKTLLNIEKSIVERIATDVFRLLITRN